MKKTLIFSLFFLLALLSLTLGCSKQSVEINGDSQNYDFSCLNDSDCVSATKLLHGCYSGCTNDTQVNACYDLCDTYPGCYDKCKELKKALCNPTIPKCVVANKEKSLAKDMECDSSQPCREPKTIKCVENKCVGEW